MVLFHKYIKYKNLSINNDGLLYLSIYGDSFIILVISWSKLHALYNQGIWKTKKLNWRPT